MADPDAIGYKDPVAGVDEKEKDTWFKNDAKKPGLAPRVMNEYVGEVLGNVLDRFDLPTYNLKLYMIGPGEKNTNTPGNEDGTTQDSAVTGGEEAREDNPKEGSATVTEGSGYLNNAVDAEPENTVVLAQTGVTEVGIDGLEITTVPTGKGFSEASTVNFTITQPNAADFPDQIVKARTYLGAPPDAMDCPLFLEVVFKGRSESDENTETWDVDAGGKFATIAGPFVYPLLLKNFSMQVTKEGSQYNFETVVKDDVYTADAFWRTKIWMTIKGRTIGQMLKSYEDQVNEYNQKAEHPERINLGLEGGHTATHFGYKYVSSMNYLTGIRRGSYDLSKKQVNDKAGTSEDYKVAGLEIDDQSLDLGMAESLNDILNPDLKDLDVHEARKKAETTRKNRTQIANTNVYHMKEDEDGNETDEIDTYEKSGNLKLDVNETNKRRHEMFSGRAPIEISIKEGITLDRVLGILLSMNKEFMDNCCRAQNPGDTIGQAVDPTKEPIWYKFFGSMEYDGFDKKRKEYWKTAHIIPYTYNTNRTDIALFPWEVDKNNSLTKEETKQRINQMKIKKAYEYIFTGRNDQILSCDIQYNEGIALLLPPERGLLGDVSLNAASVLNSTPVPKKEKIDDPLKELTDASKEGKSGSFFDQLKELKKNLEKGEAMISEIGNAAGFTGGEIKNLLENSNGAAAKKLEEALSDQTTAQAIADNITAKRKESAQANVVTQTEEVSPTESGFVYGGDLIGNTKYAEQLKSGGQKFKDDQTAADEAKKAESTRGGYFGGAAAEAKAAAEAERNKKEDAAVVQRRSHLFKSGFANVGTSKGIKNNLFTYLYDQHQSIDFLMKLDLGLRGDPWWLGKEPHKPRNAKNYVGLPASKAKEDAIDEDNYLTTSTDNYFMFSLNSPRLFDMDDDNDDNNTGLWIKEGDGTSYFISGIYMVKSVIHKFDGGVYTMDVSGVKETAISLSNADRLSDKFSYVDENRRGFSAQVQDGQLNESDREGKDSGYKTPHHKTVQGKLTGYDDQGKPTTPESLLKEKKITQEEYDAYKSWLKENAKNEAARSTSSGT